MRRQGAGCWSGSVGLRRDDRPRPEAAGGGRVVPGQAGGAVERGVPHRHAGEGVNLGEGDVEAVPDPRKASGSVSYWPTVSPPVPWAVTVTLRKPLAQSAETGRETRHRAGRRPSVRWGVVVPAVTVNDKVTLAVLAGQSESVTSKVRSAGLLRAPPLAARLLSPLYAASIGWLAGLA